MSKIPFQAVYCSSEDRDFPVAELNVHSPRTKGWQSERFASFPQELGFALVEESRVTQIQILSHQAMIATRMELFIGVGRDYASATFKRLGYLSLDSNQRSDYKARELKSVYIDARGNFIKLLLHRCYVNKGNMYNQVGVVAINVLGESNELPSEPADFKQSQMLRGEAPMHHAAQLRVPQNQLSQQQSLSRGAADLSVDISLDPHTASKLRALANAKNKAVQAEDYILAKQIKVAESELRKLGIKLAELDDAKNQAVQQEDYDQAKLMKDEVDSLRKEIDSKIQEINIPGVDLEERSFARQERRMERDEPHARRDHSPPVRAAAKETRSASPPPHVAPPRSIAADMMDDRPISGVKARDGNDDAMPDRFKDRQDSARSRGRPSTPHEEQPVGRSHVATEKERFPPGAHPLEGVPNLEDLDNPEPLGGAPTKDSGEVSQLVNLFGEYRVRCYLSKTWNLRDAFFTKAKLMLPELGNSPGLQVALPTIVDALKAGLDDKIAQVFFSSLALLEATLDELTAEGAPKAQVAPMFDSLINRLLGKLADGQARVRDASSQALLAIAANGSVGPHTVGLHTTRALPAKLKNAWRPIVSRMKLAQALAQAHGLGGHSGLSVDSVMDFVKSCNGFAHSNGEVRDAARDLTVVLYTLAGDDVQRHLTSLRPKQATEYADAFRAALEGGGPAAAQSATATAPARSAAPSSGHNRQHATQSPPREVQKMPPKSMSSPERYPGAGADPNDSQEETSTQCMFCGVENDTWDDDALDLHYWRECPMLSACPACSQIVEIAAFADHLTTECDHKDLYVVDEVSGLAIARSDMKSWRSGPYCKPVADGNAFCPLCFTSIPDSDGSWKYHLSNDCPSNPRLHQAHS